MKEKKNLIKTAELLIDALIKLKVYRLTKIQDGFISFKLKSDEAVKDFSYFNFAINKKWFKSSEHIVNKTARNLSDLLYRIQRVREILDSDQIFIPKLADIYADIEALKDEFADFKFDLSHKTISVITEPIVLEDVHFGSFEIRLHINDLPNLYNDQCYRIIALEPNKAGSDPNVTHPHVSCERLCEGDGYTAIRKAIEQGRLCDFFTLVLGVLNTYNPDSPYVKIEDWDGYSCYDCGCSISRDESYYCDNCEHEFCSSCSTYCHSCDTSLCLGCASQCPDCGRPICDECLVKCSDCDGQFCKSCINSEGLCKYCQEDRKDQENEESNDQEKQQMSNIAV
jgi:hypothetical protein